MDYIILILFLFIIIFLMLSFVILYLSAKNKLCKFTNKKRGENYTEILPKLFIGNIQSAKDLNFITKNNIEVIINCSNNINNYFINNTNIKYYKCPIDDSLEEYDIDLMKSYLPYFIKIIDESLSNNKSVLVHCYAGRQRSAALIAGYLMYKKSMSIEDSYNFIISKRPEAFHYGKSYNFHKSLEDYKNKLINV